MIIHGYKSYCGGIGDFIRSVLAYYVYCSMNNVPFYLYLENTYYKYCFDSTIKVIDNDVHVFEDIGSKSTEKTFNFLKNCKNGKYFVISNIFDFVSFEDMNKYKEVFLHDFLKKTDLLKKIIQENTPVEPFYTLHIRLGDKHMSKVNIQSDSRISYETCTLKIDDFLKDQEKRFMVFTDSDSIKKKYPNNVLPLKIFHTALVVETIAEINAFVESVAEFFIIGRSIEIYSFTNSGFSFWSAFLHNVPIYDSLKKRLDLKF